MLENQIKFFGLIVCLFLFFSASGFSQSQTDYNPSSPDSLTLIANYSLFSEYYKNKEYQSAVPYGWIVLKQNPKKFSQWIFFKMEDALWYLHDSAKVAQEEVKSIQDTMDYFYNLAVTYDPSSKGYFEVRKAYVDEIWLNDPADSVIREYEKAIKDDSTISTYYYNRLGQLYKNNMSNKNDYKTKAIDLYTYLSIKEPDNTQWPDELSSLVDNLGELAKIKKKAWDLDKNNLAKAWDYAATALKAGLYDDAVSALEFLVNKSPDNVNYWTQLAAAYQNPKVNKLTKAESAYKTLISLKPENKDYYLNLGTVYKDEGNLTQARVEYLKASEVGHGWGLAIFYEGLLYEQAARGCDFNFDTKLVYLLAVETYKKAVSIDPTLNQAKERITALASSIPTKEDYFFRGYKADQSLPITGKCYGWIDRSVTVP